MAKLLTAESSEAGLRREWDVKRLVASLAVAGRGNGFSPSEREPLVRTCAKAYRERMRTLAATGELDVWYAHTAIDDALEASVDPKYPSRRAGGSDTR